MAEWNMRRRDASVPRVSARTTRGGQPEPNYWTQLERWVHKLSANCREQLNLQSAGQARKSSPAVVLNTAHISIPTKWSGAIRRPLNALSLSLSLFEDPLVIIRRPLAEQQQQQQQQPLSTPKLATLSLSLFANCISKQKLNKREREGAEMNTQ